MRADMRMSVRRRRDRHDPFLKEIYVPRKLLTARLRAHMWRDNLDERRATIKLRMSRQK